jgi:hypothetical protein
MSVYKCLVLMVLMVLMEREREIERERDEREGGREGGRNINKILQIYAVREACIQS